MNTAASPAIGCTCPASAPASTAAAPELVAAARDVLTQALRLFEPLSAARFSEVAPAPFRASIGQHYRHVLEHFQCLLRGLALGEVNYDARQRDPRIETQPAFAASATRDVLSSLSAWTPRTLDQPCLTVSSVAYQSAEPSRLDSNIARELAYCIGHAIHHYAIVRLICAQLGVPVADEFGYAPSTLKHLSALSTE